LSEISKTVDINMPGFKATDFQKRIPVLTFIGGNQVGRNLMLAEDSITLGRSVDATIMLRDSAVSRIHLKIDYIPPKQIYQVKDLGSSNGTMLNDKKVSSAELREGDKIIVGNTVLRFSWIDNIDMAFQGEVNQLINIDPLTGLILKRRFDEEFSRHVAVALSKDSPLCMLMMDMDGLKGINDTYGHSFGAFAISEIGKMIKSMIASKGLASRFGGDEFMAFLPNTSLKQATSFAEELRGAVESHIFEKDATRFSLTISIGITLLGTRDTPDTLLERADSALYVSKNSGRNSVHVK